MSVAGLTVAGRSIPFSEILASNHVARSRAEIIDPISNTVLKTLLLEGGSVSCDRGAAIRRSCNLQLTPFDRDGVTQIPADPRDAAAPYGNQVRLYRTVELPEYLYAVEFPLGVFQIADADTNDDGAPTFSIQGYDLARVVSRNRFTTPWVIAAGTNVVSAIQNIVGNRLAFDVTFYPDDTDATVPLTVIEPEADPWLECMKMAEAAEMELYFNAEGGCVIQQVPDEAHAAVRWEYNDTNSRELQLLSVGRRMSDEPGYNGVVLTAESTTLTTPLRAEVWDDNPNSATYALGKYGRVPKFVTNQYVVTQAQADAAAAAELRRIIGGSESTGFACIPNPAIQPGDVVHVVRSKSGTDELVVVEGFDIPLGPTEGMRVITRARRAAS